MFERDMPVHPDGEGHELIAALGLDLPKNREAIRQLLQEEHADKNSLSTMVVALWVISIVFFGIAFVVVSSMR